MQLASRHLSCTWNFEVAPEFLETLWTPAITAVVVQVGYRQAVGFRIVNAVVLQIMVFFFGVL